MAFLLKCPGCGERGSYDFRFGGELTSRPSPDDSPYVWTRYHYYKKNEAGLQREWWYHKFGCRRWFQAERDTLNNRIERTFWPEPPVGQAPVGQAQE